MKALLTILATTLTFVGCASVSKQTSNMPETVQIKTPTEGKAGVYLYRDNSFQGSLLKKDLWIDGACVGTTSRNVYFYQEVDGNKKHTISTESEFSPNHLELETQAGKTYFIQQKIKMGAIVGGSKLDVIDESKGRMEIQKTKLGVSGNCSKQTIDLTKK